MLCLFDESLQAAVLDFQDVQQKKAVQEQERLEFDEQQAAAKEQAIANGTEFVPEEREWPEINTEPFQTQDEKYVVCLDAMGQDREFTIEEKRFALQTVEDYIRIWEA